ncbi:MAG: glycosyltransferase family 39 protein [Holosporaceae bacterium]|jgi:4-amino-4-deoxy-L-arabinose transferase-like glycosyltransferase|nr:glycosyltransferase family 39 protein [Holosporaceae bacterium]
MQKREFSDKIVWYRGMKGIFSLAVVLAFFFSYEMGNRHFADPDEGRYVEIPREMVVSGDYVTPKLNGLKYFEKPPLFYWMQAVAMKIFGINETSMRLWVVVFAILGCLGVFFVGAKRYSDAVGLVSSGILATNILYYAHSRLIILDLVTSVLMSGTLWCFFLSFVGKNPPKSQKFYIVFMYVFATLACLTKGLIGAVLPGVIALLWIAWTKNWSKIKEILYIPGILVFFAIFLPWHILISLRNKEFLHFYFVVEHFLRYTSTIHNRYQPIWFFIPILLVGLLPWTGFTLISISNSCKKAFSRNQENAFFVCWIFGVLCFFSLSNSKLIPYILPILPPLTLITGITLVDSLDSGSKDFQKGVCINVTLFLVAFIAYFFAKSEIEDVLQNSDATLLMNIFAGLLILAGSILIFPLYFRVSKIAVILAYMFVGANMMWIINKASVFYQEVKKPTTKQLAESINLNRREEDLVFCYKRYYQDFPVYLNSTVGVVDFVGELQFGANADPSNDKLITEDKFWKLWSTTNKRVFLLLSREHYREVFAMRNEVHRILDLDKYFVAITNR